MSTRQSEMLAAEACSALEEAITVLADLVLSDGGDPTDAFDTPVDASPQATHATGCVRLHDASHQDAGHAERIEALLAIAAAQLSKVNGSCEGAVLDRRHVMRMLSEMVGTLLLSRTVAQVHPQLADEILQATN